MLRNVAVICKFRTYEALNLQNSDLPLILGFCFFFSLNKNDPFTFLDHFFFLVYYVYFKDEKSHVRAFMFFLLNQLTGYVDSIAGKYCTGRNASLQDP